LENQPKISVIIPVFNREDHIGLSLESVINQSYSNIEIIVVDDGSTDKTSMIAQDFDAVTFYYQDNQGPAAARNTGIKLSTGDYISFLDSDDFYPTDKLNSQLDWLQNNPAETIVRFMVQYDYMVDPQRHYIPQFIDEEQQTCFSANLGSFLFHNSIFKKYGLLNEGLTIGEDIEFLNRIKDAGHKMNEVKEIGLIYRVHENSMTLKKDNVAKGLIHSFYERRKLLRSSRNERDTLKK